MIWCKAAPGLRSNNRRSPLQNDQIIHDTQPNRTRQRHRQPQQHPFSGALTNVNYSDDSVRAFALASVFWGIVGMLVGVVNVAELAWPDLNMGISWLSHGRLRPLHTNAVICAFGGCALMGKRFHVAQRTGPTRLFAPWLAMATFIGWQLVIVAMNATEQIQRYQLAVSGLDGLTLAALNTVELAAAQARWVTVVARLPAALAKRLAAGAQPIQFEISLLPAAGGAVLDGPVLREKSSFIVPR